MKTTGKTKIIKIKQFLDTLPSIVKFISLIVIVMLALTVLLSTKVTARFVARRMAKMSKTITEAYKKSGMNTATVETKLSLGLISFKVIGKDEATDRHTMREVDM